MNPFSTEPGNVPQLYLDLNKDIEEYAQRSRLLGGRSVYALFITSVKGSGKTVFMKQLGKRLSKYPDTIVVTLDSTTTFFKLIYNQLATLSPKLKKPATGNEAYYQEKVDEALALLNKEHKRVVLCLDNISDDQAGRRLADSIGDWSLNNFKVSVIMTSLPKDVDDLIMEKSLSFLARAYRFKMPALQQVPMLQAYQKTFAFKDIHLAAEMADLTQGYPYAFQLLGDLMYKAMASEPSPQQAFEKAKIAFKDNLFKTVYGAITQKLTKTDLKFLTAVGQGNNISFIAEQMKISRQDANRYRLKLTKDGLITIAGQSKLRFTLPMFKEFILKN